ncbi:MAG: lipoyl(octanoyl) transferase LipB [Actinomyces sp.]|uniref:lipoyl(octanoyl) transferase LipB n=1 Tax=Actinomyces sp. TaxID=29317 RepID=UPI0026DB7C32|nr:lipoyl(octanoyl) transferase LipB [Actinomyces sp.]MDO4242565.1 lipoyl(octanoyl) transferase LipB [Actinomyces sp.]
MERIELGIGERLVPYAEGWALQRRVHAQVVEGARPGTLILVEHEPVYTVGRRTHSWERPDAKALRPVPVIDVDRGGKATWHGPGQLTAYPIVPLAAPIDVIRYVRALEEAVIEVCAAYGVETRRVAGRSGVWVPAEPGAGEARRRTERKICALGVRVARGVTMHGIGLNVDPDLAAFDLERIIPCGIEDAAVTSLAAETGAHLRVADLAPEVAAALEQHLEPLVARSTAEAGRQLGPGSQTDADRA